MDEDASRDVVVTIDDSDSENNNNNDDGNDSENNYNNDCGNDSENNNYNDENNSENDYNTYDNDNENDDGCEGWDSEHNGDNFEESEKENDDSDGNAEINAQVDDSDENNENNDDDDNNNENDDGCEGWDSEHNGDNFEESEKENDDGDGNDESDAQVDDSDDNNEYDNDEHDNDESEDDNETAINDNCRNEMKIEVEIQSDNSCLESDEDKSQCIGTTRNGYQLSDSTYRDSNVPQREFILQVDVHRNSEEKDVSESNKYAGRLKHQDKTTSEKGGWKKKENKYSEAGQNKEKNLESKRESQNKEQRCGSEVDGYNKEQKHGHGYKEVGGKGGRNFDRKNFKDNKYKKREFKQSEEENKDREGRQGERKWENNKGNKLNARKCENVVEDEIIGDKQEEKNLRQGNQNKPGTFRYKQRYKQENSESQQKNSKFRQVNGQVKSPNNTEENREPNTKINRYTPNSSSQTPKKQNPDNLEQSEKSTSNSNKSNHSPSGNNSTSINYFASNKGNNSKNNCQNKNKSNNQNNNNNSQNYNNNNNQKNNQNNNNNNQKNNQNNNNNNQKNNQNNNKNNQNNNNNNNQKNNNNNNNQKNKGDNNNNSGQQFEPKLPADFLNTLKKFLPSWYTKKKSFYNPIDSFVLRLHYRFGSVIFLILYMTIFARWYIGTTIYCVSLYHAETKVSDFIKNFCLSYPYVCSSDPSNENCPRRYLLFYRWLPYSFLIVSGIYYIPRIIAKMKDNPRLIKLIQDLAAGEHRYDGSTWEQDTELMVNYFSKHHHSHKPVYFWLIFSHMLALFIDISTFLFYDFSLQGRFWNLTISAYPYTRDPQNFTDELSTLFPPFVKCSVERQVLINNERIDNYGCHLLVMELYEKVFIMLWFWFAFVIIITGISVIFLLLACVPPFKWAFLHTFTNSSGITKLKRKMCKLCDVDDLYVIYLMKRHRSEYQFFMFLSRYSHSHENDVDEKSPEKMFQVNDKHLENFCQSNMNHYNNRGIKQISFNDSSKLHHSTAPPYEDCHLPTYSSYLDTYGSNCKDEGRYNYGWAKKLPSSTPNSNLESPRYVPPQRNVQFHDTFPV